MRRGGGSPSVALPSARTLPLGVRNKTLIRKGGYIGDAGGHGTRPDREPGRRQRDRRENASRSGGPRSRGRRTREGDRREEGAGRTARLPPQDRVQAGLTCAACSGSSAANRRRSRP